MQRATRPTSRPSATPFEIECSLQTWLYDLRWAEHDGALVLSVGEGAGRGALEATTQALLTQQFLDYAVHVSERYRYIYVVNPKVGCSSIIWTLRRLETGAKDSSPPTLELIHSRDNSPLKRPSDIGSTEQILRDEGYFKFTFVRNPFDRLMSCYLNKIARPTAQRKVVLGLLGRSQEAVELISFDEFVGVIGRQTPTEMDPHWRPQWVQTLQGWVRYDTIGRFEDFDGELLRVGAQISSEFQSFVFSERRQATGVKPYHLITPRLAETIRELYAKDFAGFEYSLDVPSLK